MFTVFYFTVSDQPEALGIVGKGCAVICQAFFFYSPIALKSEELLPLVFTDRCEKFVFFCDGLSSVCGRPYLYYKRSTVKTR